MRTVPEVLPQLTPELGLAVPPDQLLAPIREGIATLHAARAAVDREVREAQATLIARNAARDDYDAAFSQTANALTALFRLAGMPEHADRVRPSGRRPGRVLNLEEPVEAESDAPTA